jgi:hypothetical protein
MEMRTLYKLICAASIVASSLVAGTLALQIGNPAENPEAQEKNAVLVARVTACQSPEKTAITATAEGTENGIRRSIPLKIIRLTTPGTFAVLHEWPKQGAWAVKLIATNPEYKDYATGVVVPFERTSFHWAAIKHFSHRPTDREVAEVLTSIPSRPLSSIN